MIIIFASDANDGWAKVRTQNGKVGYVKKDKLANFDTVRENMKEEKTSWQEFNISKLKAKKILENVFTK